MIHLKISTNIKTLRETLCMKINFAEITWLMVMFIWLCLHYVLADKLYIYVYVGLKESINIVNLRQIFDDQMVTLRKQIV